MGMVRIGMGEFGRGELHSPYFYWGNIFVLNLIWANAIRPYGGYNSSDSHLVGLFSLILPSLIIWVEFDCDECDWVNLIWANAIRPYGGYNSSDSHLVGLFSLIFLR